MDIKTISYREMIKKECDQVIRLALENQGFFYLTELPLTHKFLETILALSSQFFELPQSDKESIHIDNNSAYRGYTPLGGEQTNGKPDIKETLDIGPELPDSKRPLHGSNQWPKSPHQFSYYLQQYYETLSHIGLMLIRAIARSYLLQDDFFESQFVGTPFCLLRVLSYPPTPKGQFGIGPHCDYGCLNLLYSNCQEGLELQDKSGSWHTVTAKPYQLIINSGDMLSYWTNGQIRSMPHRVLHTGKQNRISLPFFFEPGFDTMVQPINSERPAIHYGTHLLKAFERSFNGAEA